MTIPFLKTNNAVSVLIGGKPQMLPATHPNFPKVIELLLSGSATPDALEELMSVRTAILRKSFGDIRIEGEKVFYKQREMAGLLVDRLLSAVHSSDQEKLDRLMKFGDSLGRNPSFRIREQLYPFLEKGQNPISANGGFIAFKKVRADFFDCHSGTIRNAPGDTPSMPREEVDDDPNRTCSSGLHVCNWGYLSSFSGAKVVLCEVMPEDVVSVPTDYNNTKMRTCRYHVLADVTGQSYESLFEGRGFW